MWLHGKAMRRRAGCRFGDCGYSARSRTSLPDRSLIVAFVGRQYLAEHAEENRAGRRGGVGKNDTTTRRFRYVDLGNPRIVESNLRTTAQRESSFRICSEETFGECPARRNGVLLVVICTLAEHL